MIKKLFSIVLVCIFCLSLVLTGCGEVTGNNDSAENAENQQASNQVMGDSVENRVGEVGQQEKDVLQGASSAKVLELAKENRLSTSDVHTYTDFKLHSAQKGDFEVLRRELTPNRSEDLPLDELMDVSTMHCFGSAYHHVNDLYGVSEYSYFRDFFFLMSNGLLVMVDYMIPGTVDNVVDCHRVFYDKDLAYYYSDNVYADFNMNLYENGDIFNLKEEYVDKVLIVNVNDRINYCYNEKGELYGIDLYYDNIFVNVSRSGSDGRAASIEDIVDKLGGVIEYAFEPDRIQLADEAITKAISDARKAVK